MSTALHVATLARGLRTWQRRWEISWSSGCVRGASSASSAIPATGSTGWLPLANTLATRGRVSSRPAMRSCPRSWQERTPSSPASPACVWPLPALGQSTCSTDCTTPEWTISPWSPSWGKPQPRPAAARHAIDRAFRIAIAEKCVTCVILPNDLQEEKAVEQQEHAHNTIHSSVGYSTPRVVPREQDLKRAADVLNAGDKVAMLVGAGCMRAGEEVIQVADLLGAGFAKALLGKAAIPDEAPGCTGSIGMLGTKASWELMSSCDTLLMVGSSFPYSEFLPKEGQARGVQIDLKARMLGIRYPMEVHLHGDAAETLRALLPYLKKKANRSWRQKMEAEIREWKRIREAQARVTARPLNPAYVFWELNPRIPDRAIFTVDTGSAAAWYARYLDLGAGMMGSLSGNLATMGPAMPYAIAAKFAYPDRPVFALAGDGAMQMNGMNDLITVEKYWRGWKDPRFVVLVLNNRDLNMVTWELRAQSGEPKFDGSQEIPDFPYAAYAESLG